MAVSVATAEPVAENKPRPTYGKVVLLLENSILPPEKLSPTPSMIDGLDPNSEIDLRVLGCELIQTSGILLKLPQVAMATGQVLFHRFYYSKSFVRHAMEVVAMACITVASKIEESPRRIRDVVNVFHHIKQVKSGKTIQPLILDQNYINLKNQVIKAERRVLKELGFCVHVKHPHKIIVTLLQVLECEKNLKLIQTAWNYMNDSLRTDVFVRYQPENIACACIHLSARLLMIPLPTKPAWYSVFNVTEDEITDIARTILHLYCRKKPDSEKLEREVEELQKAHQEAKLKARGLSASSTPNANTSSAFSPTSQPNSPKKSPVPPEPKKENGSASAHSPKHEKESNHHHHHHHHHHHNHVSSSNNSGSSHKRKSATGRSSPAPVKRSNSSSSPSPKARKTKTPPRGYKEPLRSRSRSRSRERKETQPTNTSSKHRSSSSSHKRKRSRSRNRKAESHARSPHRHSSKKYYKERSGSNRR